MSAHPVALPFTPAAVTTLLRRAADLNADRWRVYTVAEDGTPLAFPAFDSNSYPAAVSVAVTWFAAGCPHVAIVDRRSGKTALALADRIPPSLGTRQ